MDKETLDWYEAHASSYSLSTKDSLVKDALGEFLSFLPPCSRILDLGCGSGRDSAYFLSLGHNVDSIDGSAQMAKEAKRLFGIDVRLCDILSLDANEEYRGIWAQASLLHLTIEELVTAFRLIERALEEDGILYASFRIGTFDTREEGRLYTNMTEERLRSLLSPSLSLEKTWESKDVRKGMDHRWLNSIIRKRSVPGQAG